MHRKTFNIKKILINHFCLVSSFKSKLGCHDHKILWMFVNINWKSFYINVDRAITNNDLTSWFLVMWVWELEIEDVLLGLCQYLIKLIYDSLCEFWIHYIKSGTLLCLEYEYSIICMKRKLMKWINCTVRRIWRQSWCTVYMKF